MHELVSILFFHNKHKTSLADISWKETQTAFIIFLTKSNSHWSFICTICKWKAEQNLLSTWNQIHIMQQQPKNIKKIYMQYILKIPVH